MTLIINLFKQYNLIRTVVLLAFVVCYSNPAIALEDYDVGFKVIDINTRSPLVGVTIHTDDYSKAEITDNNGYVFFTDINYRDSLSFSYIGYETKKLTVKQILNANKFIKMTPEAVSLDEVVVVGKIGRTDDPIVEIPYEVKEISAKQIELKNPGTTADALEKLGGAYVQRSQLGGGSPNIRGFEANRVLLVVDGVRLNNAIFRSGHLQNSITIDNSIIDQIEVISGPGSIMYGSDALGGVVHFRTKDPQLNRTDEGQLLKLNSFGRFSSATYEKTGHLDMNLGYKKWAFLSSATVSIFESLETGSNRSAEYEGFGFRPFYVQRARVDQVRNNPNPTVLEESGYNQVDVMQKIRFQPNDSLYFIGNLQYSTTTDIPRYDKLIDTLSRADDLEYAEWFYGPQQRFLGSLKARLLKPNALYNKATFIASYQDISEDRNTRKFANSTRQQQAENVSIQTYTADFTKFFDRKEQNMLTYGLDVNYNTVTSKVSQIRVNDGTVDFDEGVTRYPNAGSTMDTKAAYLGYRWRSANNRINLQGGARYTSVNVTLKYRPDGVIVWPEDFYGDGLDITNNDLTWGFGGGYQTDDKWHLKLNVAKAFRAPNVDDFARIREKGGKLTVPNVDLRPETSINQEITLSKTFDKLSREKNTGSLFHISATGFMTDLTDAIIQVDAPLREGVDQLLFEGDLADTQKKINATSATIRGLSFNMLYNLRDQFMIEGGVNITKGESTFSNEIVQDTIIPFSHIPPLYGQFGLTYKTEKLTLQAQARFNGAKKIEDYAVSDIEANGVIDREGTSDNLEFTPWVLDDNGHVSYLGASAWTTLNLYSSIQLTKKISLNLAVENVFDKFYVPFASSIASPGRNFIITLRGKI